MTDEPLQYPAAWEALVSGQPGRRDPESGFDLRRPRAGHYIVAVNDIAGHDGLDPLTVVGPYPAGMAGLRQAKAILVATLSALRVPARVNVVVKPVNAPSGVFPDPDGIYGGEAACVFPATRPGGASYTRLGIVSPEGLYNLAVAVAAAWRESHRPWPSDEPANGVRWLVASEDLAHMRLAALVRADVASYA